MPQPSQPPTAPLLCERHPVHDLLQRTMRKASGLLSTGTTLYPQLDAQLARFALSHAGGGLDHTLGEQPLVFADFSVDQGRIRYKSYFLMTDRRFITSKPYSNIRYSEIEEVHYKKGMLVTELRLRKGQEWNDVGFVEIEVQIRDFLRTLTAQPPAQREPPPRPLCPATEQDPTGAQTAMGWLPVPDSRTQLMLTYVRESFARQLMPLEVAQDFVARLTVAYRNLGYGRGFHQTRHMSPISANDLSQLFVHMFGNPVWHAEEPVRRLVFNSKMRSNSGVAALSTVAGAASKVLLGVGWSHRARPSVSQFEVMLADTGPFASYKLVLTNGGQGLHTKVPVFCDDVHYNLMTLEDALLLRRCVYGWNARPLELMQSDPQDVIARITEVVGPFDPQLLGRRV